MEASRTHVSSGCEMGDYEHEVVFLMLLIQEKAQQG